MILKKKDFFDVFSYIEARVKVFKKLSRYKDLVAIAQKRFLTVKDNLFRKLRKTPILLEEALSYYKEIEVSKKPVEIKEQDNEKLLTDKEILEEALKYCSDPSTLLLPVKSRKNISIKKRELKDFIYKHKQLVSRIVAIKEGYEDYKTADEKELVTVIAANTNLYE